jgi:hypothetical protein
LLAAGGEIERTTDGRRMDEGSERREREREREGGEREIDR